MAYDGFGFDQLMIRKKILSFLGQKFHIYAPDGRLVFFTKQKAFRLKEDIRVFEDEAMTREVLWIQARGMLDFGMTYDVVDSGAREKVGALRRKGMASIIRDEWHVLDGQDRQIGVIREDSTGMALARRFLSNLIPQHFFCEIQGRRVMQFDQHFNPFVAKIDLDFRLDTEYLLDRRLGVAAGVLLSAVEGRQKG